MGEGISERIPVVYMAQSFGKFFSKLHSFTALLQKVWGFPKSCGGVGIGSEFQGIYLLELLLSLMWSLKRHIYFCVLFCANKKWLFFVFD